MNISSLIPGMESFMTSFENDNVENKDSSTKEPTQTTAISTTTELAVKNVKPQLEQGVSLDWEGNKKPHPYCPVFVTVQDDDKTVEYTSYLEGPINDVDQYIDLIDYLFTAPKNSLFNIYIDSPGGLISSGGIISSMIHHCDAEVNTVARGLCASSAALIHSSAKPGHSKVSPTAVLMYHMSSHGDSGLSTRIAKRAANQVRYVNECLLNKAVAEGHITEEELGQIQNGKEFFIPAKDFNKRVNGETQVENVHTSIKDQHAEQPVAVIGNESIYNGVASPYSFLQNEIAGNESFESKFGSVHSGIGKPFFDNDLESKLEKLQLDESASMGPNGQQGSSRMIPIIRTSDNKNYRVYVKTECWFTGEYIARLCRFLDSRVEDETVTFILGARMLEWQSHLIGAVISSISDCKAKVITIAAGYCSIPETMIWAFGDERVVYRYGALSFGRTDFVDRCAAYEAYFDVFFERSKEIGIITDADIEEIKKTGFEKMILFHEVNQ